MSAVAAETDREVHTVQARGALLKFLEWCVSKAVGLWPEQMLCIKTTLLKLYAMLGHRTKLANLLKDTTTVLEESSDLESHLRAGRQFCALGWLRCRQGQDEEALGIWKQVAEGELMEQTDHAAAAECSAPFGVHESIELLAKCVQSDIWVQCSRWLLQDYPALAIQIFVPCQREIKLAPQAVIDHLQYYTDELVMQFLEYAAALPSGYTIDQRTMLHTRLALRYLEAAVGLEHEHETRKRLRGFLEGSDCVDWSALLKHHMMSGEVGAAMVAEKAILFRKSHQHYQALLLLVWHSGSSSQDALKAAEEYCLSTGWADAESEIVFNTLLQVYLTPPAGHLSKLPDALNLLQKYGDKFDPIEAIGWLPPDTPIKAVETFLEKALMHTSHICRSKKIERQMSRQLKEQRQLELMRDNRSRVQVDQNHVCPVCNRKLGTAAIGVLPRKPRPEDVLDLASTCAGRDDDRDLVVVHFMCLRPGQPHICPITGYNFQTQQEAEYQSTTSTNDDAANSPINAQTMNNTTVNCMTATSTMNLPFNSTNFR